MASQIPEGDAQTIKDIEQMSKNNDIEGLLALAQKALDDTRELLKKEGPTPDVAD